MESAENGGAWVEIISDALVGQGKVLRCGELVPAHTLEPHLVPLLSAGAVIWKNPSPGYRDD